MKSSFIPIVVFAILLLTSASVCQAVPFLQGDKKLYVLFGISSPSIEKKTIALSRSDTVDFAGDISMQSNELLAPGVTIGYAWRLGSFEVGVDVSYDFLSATQQTLVLSKYGTEEAIAKFDGNANQDRRLEYPLKDIKMRSFSISSPFGVSAGRLRTWDVLFFGRAGTQYTKTTVTQQVFSPASFKRVNEADVIGTEGWVNLDRDDDDAIGSTTLGGTSISKFTLLIGGGVKFFEDRGIIVSLEYLYTHVFIPKQPDKAGYFSYEGFKVRMKRLVYSVGYRF